jgi:hypothetical protein
MPISAASPWRSWARPGAPAPTAIALPPIGLCAPGAQLVMVMRGTPPPGVRYRGPRMVCLAPRRR